MLDKEMLSQASYAISHELLRRMPANKGVEYIRGYSRGSQIAHEVITKMIGECAVKPPSKPEPLKLDGEYDGLGRFVPNHTEFKTNITTPKSVGKLCLKHGAYESANGMCPECN